MVRVLRRLRGYQWPCSGLGRPAPIRHPPRVPTRKYHPLAPKFRLGNMVGGLGWLRRRVCTCRLGSPIHQTDKKWMDFLHFRDFASPTMAHPRCRELYKRAGSLRLAELFRPILFLLLPGSYSFLKLEGSGVRVSAGSTLHFKR